MPGEQRASVGQLSIVVAEDDDEIGQLIALVLEAEGHEVFRAANGVQALELVDRYHPRLLLLDLNMPRLDGFDVLRALGARPDRPVVVAMSAFHHFLPEAITLGAAAIIET